MRRAVNVAILREYFLTDAAGDERPPRAAEPEAPPLPLSFPAYESLPAVVPRPDAIGAKRGGDGDAVAAADDPQKNTLELLLSKLDEVLQQLKQLREQSQNKEVITDVVSQCVDQALARFLPSYQNVGRPLETTAFLGTDDSAKAHTGAAQMVCRVQWVACPRVNLGSRAS
eukprot:TRINITY_DN4168_c0_g1_i2.p1 TRINITY_DN4168_c0_g1~~TRINITY_DN4168_c0_g1_i2.p1  ORF type:complete len:171 (+),score=39.64 TRINITY_DN4168_c0_g1_i2:56-568(+)